MKASKLSKFRLDFEWDLSIKEIKKQIKRRKV